MVIVASSHKEHIHSELVHEIAVDPLDDGDGVKLVTNISNRAEDGAVREIACYLQGAPVRTVRCLAAST